MIELVKNFTEPKMCWNTVVIQFDAMSEVLLSFGEVTLVCKLGRQMNAGSKVRLINEKALLKVINGLFHLLLSFKLTAQIEMASKAVLS